MNLISLFESRFAIAVLKSLGSLKTSILGYKGIYFAVLNFFLFSIWLFVSDPADWFKDSYSNSKPIFSLEELEIGKIVLGRKDHEITISKTDLDWFVETAKIGAGPGDTEKISSFIHSLLSLRKFTRLNNPSEKKIEHPEFGLVGEEPSIEIFAKDGSSFGKISVGSTTDGDRETYILEHPTDTVWLVEENLRPVSGRFAEDYFYSRKLFGEDLSVEELIHLEFFMQTAIPFQLIRETEGWVLQEKDQKHRASEQEINLYLRKLLGLKADAFLFPSEEKVFPISKSKFFRFQIRFRFSSIELFPIGVTKDASWVFEKPGLSYKFVVDPWNLEEILHQNPKEFLGGENLPPKNF
ncbi:DUF4340 domain-containing protein [Leptospira perolatii]|uniref:DUF4340 domain-containing protein n=1 Tax=Leptospira perolatii TaxID=2023191 RepID=UPI0013FD864C|nr:DUF4340 domain-containing protein [Leptospira perolatii]